MGKFKVNSMLVSADSRDQAVNRYKKIRDAVARIDIIKNLKAAHIGEREIWECGQTVSGWYAQIQNHGSQVYADITKYPHASPKQVSKAWGRIWYNGQLVKMFEGPLNVVRLDMIRFLSDQTKDSIKDATLDEAGYWKIRYGNEDDPIQYTSVVLVKGMSEQEVIEKFHYKTGNRYKIFSVTEGAPEGVESLRRRGMSVIDNCTHDVLSESQVKELVKKDPSIYAICLYVKDKKGRVITPLDMDYAFIAHSAEEYSLLRNRFAGERPVHDFEFVTAYNR